MKNTYCVLILCVLSLKVFKQVNCDYDYCVTSDNRSGKCTDLDRCPSTFALLGTRPMPTYVRNKLRVDHCGFNGSMPKVCCPPLAVNSYGEAVTPYSLFPVSTDLLPPNITEHRNFNLLPKACGQSEENKILGGMKTGIYEYPWMALIAYYQNKQTSYGCGGSIISMDYILTAAHCLINLELGQSIIGVRVGEHNLNTDKDCEGSKKKRYCAPDVQDFLIREFFTHENYNRFSRQNDIGIVRLADSIDFSKYNTQPICLPMVQELSTKDLSGLSLTVAGWGLTEENITSPELLSADVLVIDNTRCKEIYSSSDIKIFHKHICAGGQSGVDSCNGDSGGPLMMLSRIGQTSAYVQFGIVSVGPEKCGSPGKPAVYTRIAFYMDWLLDKMRPAIDEDYE